MMADVAIHIVKCNIMMAGVAIHSVKCNIMRAGVAMHIVKCNIMMADVAIHILKCNIVMADVRLPDPHFLRAGSKKCNIMMADVRLPDARPSLFACGPKENRPEQNNRIWSPSFYLGQTLVFDKNERLA